MEKASNTTIEWWNKNFSGNEIVNSYTVTSMSLDSGAVEFIVYKTKKLSLAYAIVCTRINKDTISRHQVFLKSNTFKKLQDIDLRAIEVLYGKRIDSSSNINEVP